LQFRYRGSRRESAVAQLSTLGVFSRIFMTTSQDILQFLDIHQHTPVRSSRYASRESRLRVQTDQMRLAQLPVQSIALFIEHGAQSDTPERAAANQQLEDEGFVSYRLLAPVMRRIFSDVWPS
jgi:hypothetical protein